MLAFEENVPAHFPVNIINEAPIIAGLFLYLIKKQT